MRKYTSDGLLLLLFVACLFADDCAVSIIPTKLSSWEANTETYSIWEVQVVSASSASITTLELYLPSPPKVIHVWQINSGKPDYYTLPNDSALFRGGSSHTFGYIVQGSSEVNITISDITCACSSVDPSLYHALYPRDPGSFDKVCDVVLVIDNFIVRENPDLDAIRNKYTSYFGDIDLFYQKHFKTKMNLIHIHLEEGPTFSVTTNEGELLDSFRSALAGGFFGPDIPKSACAYHLVTGRDPPGIGGLSWIDTLCNSAYYNSGFSVDLRSQDEPGDVLRRMIHELGHGFGGQHFDFYNNNPLYTCETGDTRASDRVLRSTNGTRGVACHCFTKPQTDVGYKYINGSLFISPCASNTIRNSMPSFSCLWRNASAANLPSVTLYENRDFTGLSTVVYARKGITPTTCYNIVYPYGKMTAAFKLDGIRGIRFFESQDCIGQEFEFPNTTATYVGNTANHEANSCGVLLLVPHRVSWMHRASHIYAHDKSSDNFHSLWF